MLLSSCSAGPDDSWRNGPVSEITLAEPLFAEKKLLQKVRELRSSASAANQELSVALAELSLVHGQLEHYVSDKDSEKLHLQVAREAREAFSLVEPEDTTSKAYFLSRRAFYFVACENGGEAKMLIEPLLRSPFAPLDKAQIYNDLAEGEEYGVGKKYIEKALKLRMENAGPYSLEVAESLMVASNIICAAGPIDTALCSQLDLLPALKSHRYSMENRGELMTCCRRRAAVIRERVLGPWSLQLAEALSSLDEKDKLRAIAIYERQLGPDSNAVRWAYTLLAESTEDSAKKALYNKRAGVASALQEAGRDPFKTAYVNLKSVSSSASSTGQPDGLAVAFRAFGCEPPKIVGPESKSGSVGQMFTGKELGISDIDVLNASCSISERAATLAGFKDKKEIVFQYLPSRGTLAVKFSVVGKGLLRFWQAGPGPDGFQQIDYLWNGKTFEASAFKVSPNDEAIVRAAIDDAVKGYGYYGLSGHHCVDSAQVKGALASANIAAENLYREGYPLAAAVRLRTMFELTSDLIEEASTAAPLNIENDNNRDDVVKWKKYWACNSKLCVIGLKESQYRPFLRQYAFFLQKAGQTDRARKVLAAI